MLYVFGKTSTAGDIRSGVRLWDNTYRHAMYIHSTTVWYLHAIYTMCIEEVGNCKRGIGDDGS